MKIDSTVYNGACSCGREHTMVTRAAIIEPGCLNRFEDILAEYGIGSGKRCAIYGENGFAATADRHPQAEQTIVLNPEGLHANEISTAEVLSKLEQDVELLIAVGSGTIHDITRFVAHERGIPFISCPTGASVDGFCSTVASMTWYGYKKTMPAVAPELVIADIEIIRDAPMELVRSGVGDIMAKYIALTDWRIAKLLTGEYLCRRIYDIMHDAVETVINCIPGLLRGEDEAYAAVTYALVMSGLAMQMMGNSRPASGAEHHFSHLIEMQPAELAVRFPAMHGEKTGVGTIVALREYKRLALVEDVSPLLVPFAPVSDQYLTDYFGEALAPALIEENRNDCLAAVTPERIAECWSEIRRIIEGLPEPERLYSLLEELGAKRNPEDIGVTAEDIPAILTYSPLVRNRLTLMRARRMIRE